MFNKQNEKEEYKEAETIIGPSIKVTGDFHGEGSIIIEGMVEGSLKTSGNLLVGNNAKIIANIKAKEAKIGGDIKGNINVEGFLEIGETAIINGDIEAQSISISRGAIFNGKCLMSKGANAVNDSDSDRN